jgi:NTE family protein
VKRIGLVLGAGGSVGMAFHGGVLAALEEATGWDPRTAEIVVGTSAGSLSAALLRRGLSSADLRAMSEGGDLSDEGAVLASMGQPHRPRTRPAAFVGVRRPAQPSVARRLLRPWSLNPLALWAALLPEGPVSTDALSSGLDLAADGRWPGQPLWICSVRLRDGRRVVFGRPGSPRAPLGQAVAASCAIPGFFRPVAIGGDRYVDGAVGSVHNLDLLAGERLDAVVVSAPMSYAGRRPPLALDTGLRQVVRIQLEWEISRLRRRGIPVVTVAPTRRVVATMGVDAMDARRRGAVSRQAALATLAWVERTGLTEVLGTAGGARRPGATVGSEPPAA